MFERDADPAHRAHEAQGLRRRGLARRQAQPPAYRRDLRRGGGARPQLPRDGVRAGHDAGGARRRWTTLLPLHKVVEIIFKSIRALEYAFQHGIIHRDIKPGNILLSERGETKVSDFGASFQQPPGPRHHPDRRHRLAGLHVARAGAHGAAQPADRHLLARRDHVSPAHRAAAVQRHHPGRARLRDPQHRAAGAGDAAPRPAAAARPHRAAARSPRIRRSAIRSWLEFGKELSQAFTALRLIGETRHRLGEIQRAAPHGVLRGLRRRGAVGGGAHRQLEHPAGATAWSSARATRATASISWSRARSRSRLEAKQLATIQPGGCFGEMVYFARRQSRRTTTITARTEVTIIEIRAAALHAATDACQIGVQQGGHARADRAPHPHQQASGGGFYSALMFASRITRAHTAVSRLI